MDEGLDRSGSDHIFKNVPNDGVNLLLDERVPHGLDKVNDGRQKKAVILNQNERMSTSTIAPNFPSRLFDTLYFFWCSTISNVNNVRQGENVLSELLETLPAIRMSSIWMRSLLEEESN